MVGRELEELIGTEKRFWTEGPDFYRAHARGDCMFVFPGLGALDLAQAMAGLENGSRWRRVEISNARFAHPRDDVGIVTYRASARRTGDDAPYRAQVSSVYVRDGGSWTLAFHQHTTEA